MVFTQALPKANLSKINLKKKQNCVFDKKNYIFMKIFDFFFLTNECYLHLLSPFEHKKLDFHRRIFMVLKLAK